MKEEIKEMCRGKQDRNCNGIFCSVKKKKKIKNLALGVQTGDVQILRFLK